MGSLGPMRTADRDAFLDRRDPALCAAVSTVQPDGSPRTVPVWYRWDGERILLWTGAERRWLANLLRDPRVAVSVHEHTSPWSAVVVRGEASVRTGSLAELLDEIRAIASRYLPADEVDSTIESYDDGLPHAIVTIAPRSLVAWHTPS